MIELTCDQCRELAAELALGVLPGGQHARVLAHINGCGTCHNTVSELATTTDRLIELMPGAEPPAGFDHRVISALTSQQTPQRRRARRQWIAAAAVLVAFALAAGGWVLGQATAGVRPVPHNITAHTILVAPLTAHGRQIGQAFAYPGQPSWIYLSVDTDNAADTGPLRCELVRKNGSPIPAGTFSVAKGYGSWAASVDFNPDTLAAVRLITASGATLATAHFAN